MLFIRVDFACNHLGGWDWISVLDWTGSKAFGEAETHDWVVNGKVAGETRKAGKLTWATIYGAGHLVRSRCLICKRCKR